MSVIEAVSRTVKTMADGTLRLTVDISPIHAQDAFSLFGMPDAPIALARLTQEAATHSAQAETIADYAEKQESNRVTGLALLAVQWCQMPEFWDFLMGGLGYSGYVKNEFDAAVCIKTWCDIESRKELNTNNLAATVFNNEIRIPFMAWLQERA